MSNDVIIVNAAIPRLERGFSVTQSKLLASMMVLQSKYETANFTSNEFKLDNNGFGYKYYAGSLYQDGQGIISSEGDPYAHFDSLQGSSMEVADWLVRRKSDFEDVKTVADYANALKKNDYFGQLASSYAAGMSSFGVDVLFGASALTIPILLFIGYFVYNSYAKGK